MAVKGWIFAVALVVATVAISGCAGSKALARIDPNRPDSSPRFDHDTGAIRGQVLTEEELPIPGASAGVVALGIIATGDAEGLFSLNNVPPGEHEVMVQALGFLPAPPIKVNVVAGAATDIIPFHLVEDFTGKPFHATVQRKVELTGVMWKVTPTCIYTDINPLVKTCGGIRQACPGSPDPCEGHTARETEFKGFTKEWKTVVGEVRWQAQSGATGKGFLFDLNAPNITRGTSGAINQADPYTFKKAANKSPIQIRVDKDALGARGIKEKDWNNYNSTEPRCMGTAKAPPNDNCDWFYRLFPAAYDAGIGEDGFGPDYGVSYQNIAEIYFTYFVLEKAEPGYTALPAV